MFGSSSFGMDYFAQFDTTGEFIYTPPVVSDDSVSADVELVTGKFVPVTRVKKRKEEKVLIAESPVLSEEVEVDIGAEQEEAAIISEPVVAPKKIIVPEVSPEPIHQPSRFTRKPQRIVFPVGPGSAPPKRISEFKPKAFDRKMLLKLAEDRAFTGELPQDPELRKLVEDFTLLDT